VKLYSYFRSSAAYRVRIALNLKGIAYETTSIHLVKDGGHNKRPEFRAVNPQMRVPTLVTPGGDTLIQSLAIIEYLDETQPEPPLLPKDPVARAKVRALADLIACDIHPLNNTSPLRYLKHELHQEQSAIDAWYHHWVLSGFEALEALIEPGPYACGKQVTIAEFRWKSFPKSSPSMLPVLRCPLSTGRGPRTSRMRNSSFPSPLSGGAGVGIERSGAIADGFACASTKETFPLDPPPCPPPQGGRERVQSTF
jgi:maleylacetoacetate isomerase